MATAKSGMWAQASRLAEQTPEARNRYVDLLRALSIGAVVLGHWVMAAPHLGVGGPRLDHLLDVLPWSRWLTWGFQVMPIFFFVGGYSNGTSWDSALEKEQPYAVWLEARLRRLLGPVVPLIVLWGGLGILGFWLGISEGMIRIGSQVALVPVWFLAIYLLIVMLVPITRSIWRRLGLWSVLLPALLAAGNDFLFFRGEAVLGSDLRLLGWLNYLLIWSAVHQLGYAWQAGRLAGRRTFVLFALGASALVALTQFGPYPTSLVGVPSQEISNTTPPKLPLFALGLAQIGLFLSLEGPIRKWLARKAVWTSVVLVNGMIMTVFLWHSTVMMLVVGAGFWLVPSVFDIVPGVAAWWAWRPIWVLGFALATFPFLLVFTEVERRISAGAGRKMALARLLGGAALLCGGLALLAAGGVGGDGPLGLNWLAVLMPVVGGKLAGFGPLAFLGRDDRDVASG
ncbi:MAG: acyltransferase [Myxococcota bacterium]